VYRVNINKRFDEITSELKYNNYLAKNYNNICLNLNEHTKNVLNEIENILFLREIALNKYSKIINKDLEIIYRRLMYSVLFHDWGKVYYLWQRLCQENNLRSIGLRHEFIYMLKILDYFRKTDFNLTYQELFVKYQTIIIPIISHHNKMSYRHSDKLIETETKLIADKDEAYNKLCNELSKLGINTLESKFLKLLDNIGSEFLDYTMSEAYDTWYLNSMPRYYLQLADRRASIIESGTGANITKAELDFDFNLNKSWKLRNLQVMARDNAYKKLTLLRAPTGSGKSLGAILWGKEIIDSSRADRFIITMPTKFTSNSISKSLESYGLKVNTHHSNSKMDKYILNDYNLNEFVHSKNIEFGVNVCTIDHILNALTLSNEDHHGRLFNITNSCIVIDESDFYSEFINANILKLLEFTYKFDIPVMIMSATLPDSYVNFIENNTEYKNLAIEDDKSDLKRNRVNIKDIISHDELYNKLDDIIDKNTGIIYVNTIQKSIEIYNYLCKISDRDDIVLYHSRFKESDKNDIENRIISLLGEDANKKNKQHGIVIMTQIGELSINISAEYILSEMCPIDRLVQRLGRGRRFDKGICEVDLFYDDNIPFPYVVNEGNEFKPSSAYTQTKKILKKGLMNGGEYIRLVNKVYPKFELSKESIDNSNLLGKEFKNNIILNSKFENNEENEYSELKWRCRDIIEQVKIYIGIPKDYYNSIMELEFDKMINSVTIPVYKIKKFNNLIIETEIKIVNNGEKRIIKSVSDEFYSKEIGLIYPEKDNKVNNII